MTTSPASATKTGGARRSLRVTRVPGDATMTPAHCSPIIAISRPMPAAIACFSEAGMVVISFSRRPNPAVAVNRSPDTATPPSATSHGTSMATTTVKAK